MTGWSLFAAALMVAAAEPVADTDHMDPAFLDYLGMEAESGWAEFFDVMPLDPTVDGIEAVPAVPADESHDES